MDANEKEDDRRYALWLLNDSLNMARNAGDWDAQGAFAYAVRATEKHSDLVDALTEALDDWLDEHAGEPMPPWAIEAERLVGGAS